MLEDDEVVVVELVHTELLEVEVVEQVDDDDNIAVILVTDTVDANEYLYLDIQQLADII